MRYRTAFFEFFECKCICSSRQVHFCFVRIFSPFLMDLPSFSRTTLLIGAGTFASLASGQSADSDAKLRQIMERAKVTGAAVPQASGSAAASAFYQTRKSLNAEQTAARAELLTEAEGALSRMEVDKAELLFDRAANMLHAADTEIGLVRTYMQGGAYRRALAFGAHTAGVHLDVIGGSALYAWLLQVGGQTAVAQRLTAEALARQPNSGFMQTVAKQLQSSKPLADEALLAPPTRLAPYGDKADLPAKARVVGSAVLLADGKEALVPLALLPTSDKVWVRNGMGHLSKARIKQRHAALGIAVLTLSRSLPVAERLLSHSGQVFPGSAGYAIEYVTNPSAAATWPMLHIGFLGMPVGNSRQLALGLELKDSSGGGPVFDAAGRLLGLAVPGNARGPTLLVSTEDLQKVLGQPMAPPAPGGSAPRAELDLVYEASLRVALQLITAP